MLMRQPECWTDAADWQLLMTVMIYRRVEIGQSWVKKKVTFKKYGTLGSTNEVIHCKENNHVRCQGNV